MSSGMGTLLLTCAALAAASPNLTAGERAAIRINGDDQGEPVSKYIYGQFIEHLGRCIYGGIWAEMLEDRKFFEAVGSQQSPWRALDKAAVDMVNGQSAAIEPMAGRHMPSVRVAKGQAGGIVQRGLGLVKGRRYVGRVWLAASPGAALRVEARLVWGDGKNARRSQLAKVGSGEFLKTPLEFTAAQATADGRLEIAVNGSGTCYIGPVSLMPADNVDGMRADTLALLKELDAPIYRWPGGNFVSGYDWRDGIGDPDRRPPRKNPAWQGIEHNDFGIDEFMTFCRLLATEPLVVVNSGLGAVELAVDELEYANSPADTPMGRLRASHGHAEPYAVRWWGVGNEMYGNWQLGHMPLEEYIEKHNTFADALRRVDPSVRLIGVGAVGPWSEAMLQHAADRMELISEHFYCKEKADVVAHVAQMRDNVLKKAEAHRGYRRDIPALAGKDIRIALDEYNYWYGPHVYGELGTRYFLKDALGIAVALNEMVRQSDLFFMANYAQTVNVIGAIKTTKTAAAFDTTGLVLKLYRRHLGGMPLKTDAPAPLDAQATLSADGKTLTLAVVNPTPNRLQLPLDTTSLSLAKGLQSWHIAGGDPMAYNEPGKDAAIEIVEGARPEQGQISLPPYSVTLQTFERRR